ncbi:MAG: flagellar basal-body rod protein FlgG [Zetaproteobacteria bacterium]|nr:flagellar basal-body rod protein FlgG [Zetaproteobacteria bacterium]
MIQSLWTASTGMAAQATNVDVISNNLANANTTGFKRSRAHFQDLMYMQMKLVGSQDGAGNQTPTGIQVGLGVKTAGVEKVFTQGSYQNTNNDFDLAIEGKGFFQVQMPDGTMGYTRSGTFSLDGNGQLVTQDGYPLQPAINIPADATAVNVAADGSVSVQQAGGLNTVVGQITLANFTNSGGLMAMGHSIFQETLASGAAVVGAPAANGIGSIAQGMLETSNVNAVEEMVGLIAAQRAYEMNSKAVTAADEMMQSVNGLKR